MILLANVVTHFLSGTFPWWGAFLAAFLLTLALVPLVRSLNERLGMVDKPSARRINTTPIPRGGGLAVFLAVVAVGVAFPFATGRAFVPGLTGADCLRHLIPPAILVAVGFLDDKFGLRPRVKLAGQFAAVLTAVFVCRLGFAHIIPGLPKALDVLFGVFWLMGAINAFNLIDGLDGLASGLACIATLGMAGSLFCIGHPELTYLHLILTGALLGFLRYNFHPASVFLGDCGSMFIGYTVAAFPLLMPASDSFLVGVGIPLLAMGVPIFDTSLAILRRTVRAALKREGFGRAADNDRVMNADTDHLHHRILRKFASQRKAAFVLYGFAGLLVAIGLGGVLLQGRAASLFIVGFTAVAFIIFRDMRRIELWDAGRLMNVVAHDSSLRSRRRRSLLAVPLLVVADLAVFVLAWFATAVVFALPITVAMIHRWLILYVVPTFLAFVFCRAYTTVWARALLSNYVRLFLAIVCGLAVTVSLVILGDLPDARLVRVSLVYGAFSAVGALVVRLVRPAARDLFYALESGRLAEMPQARRLLIYGAGLRYRTFRRELVRSASEDERRVIVGLIDDDFTMKNLYIGGVRIYGTLESAPDVIRRLRIDEVVVTAVLTPKRRAIARQIFAKAGVPATLFSLQTENL